MTIFSPPPGQAIAFSFSLLDVNVSPDPDYVAVWGLSPSWQTENELPTNAQWCESANDDGESITQLLGSSGNFDSATNQEGCQFCTLPTGIPCNQLNCIDTPGNVFLDGYLGSKASPLTYYSGGISGIAAPFNWAVVVCLVTDSSKTAAGYRLGAEAWPCLAGSACPDDSLYGSMTLCEAGTYSAAGATSCTPCAAGTYSNFGATSCTSCSSGATCTGDLWSTGVELTEDELFDAHWRFSKGGDNSAISSSAFSPAPISYSYVDWISVADTNGRWTGVSDAEPGWYTFTTPFYSPVGFTLTGNFSVDDHPGSLIVSPSSDSALLDQTVTWDHLGVFTFTSMSPSSSISFTVENTGGALGLFVSFTSLTLHCPAGSFSSVISTEPLQATCEPCAAGKYSSAGATSCTNFDAILWNTCSSLRYIRITAVSILNFGELEVINFTGSNVAFKKKCISEQYFFNCTTI
jgi:hypothetical protein